MSYRNLILIAASKEKAAKPAPNKAPKKAKPALKKMPKAKVKLCEECEKPEAKCECEKEE